MLKNNKLKLFGIATMLFTLVSCGDIVAKPENKDDQLVVNNDGSKLELDNNNYDVDEDLIEDGVINTTVFSDLMYQIAEKELASYYTGDDAIFTEEEFNAEVEKLVNEKLYDYISSSSYQTDNHFDERKCLS